MCLFSYKLTHDSGFAPNPFWGALTLATCKPGIRRTKKEGDWIAGFTSKELCGDEVGHERLIYLMKVTSKIPINRYFEDTIFKDKIPCGIPDGRAAAETNRVPQSKTTCSPVRPTDNDVETPCVHQIGDNIYKFEQGVFIRQIRNARHHLKHQKRDLSGEYVLVSKKFYYFGGRPVEIPDNVRPKIPALQTYYGVQTHDRERAKAFIAFVRDNYKLGIHAAPHGWPDSDTSWKSP